MVVPKPQKSPEEVLKSFARATGASKNEAVDADGLTEYGLEEPAVRITLDSREEPSTIEVVPSDPIGFWESRTCGPASHWKVDQTVDGGNLLTTLYFEAEGCDIVSELSVWGPPAKSTAAGIELDIKNDRDRLSEELLLK